MALALLLPSEPFPVLKCLLLEISILLSELVEDTPSIGLSPLAFHRHIRFEHSPGRIDGHYFGHGTAFNAIFDCISPDGEPAVITVEVKFIEDMIGPTAAASGPYVNLLRRIFHHSDFEQLHHEHVMTQLMLQHGLAARGRFVLIAPALNQRA